MVTLDYLCPLFKINEVVFLVETNYFHAFLISRILWKKNEVADYEATTFSIFYNNALYLVLLILLSFYVLRTFNPTMYPFLSGKSVFVRREQMGARVLGVRFRDTLLIILIMFLV